MIRVLVLGLGMAQAYPNERRKNTVDRRVRQEMDDFGGFPKYDKLSYDDRIPGKEC